MTKTLFAILSTLVFYSASLSLAAKPNVVIVITDDQGYGDLSCHGNPILKTPNLDMLHGESLRLTDYHVSPTCSPTRAAFLTGHWTNRTGVWHTIMGRSMLRENEVTMGQVFKDAGYATGMFGKWHLGDNYPYRPEDRGYTEVLRHGGGGVGQTPDYWDNAYVDGSYYHNGKPTPAKGFCTDVFFDYATKFIKTQKEAGKPFLAYITTNAPHGPMHAPEDSAKPYLDKVKGNTGLAHFYGMIANIDDNVGKLRAFLKEEGLEENTIFIFTTDNGSSSGAKVHNNEMRGNKGSEYDGGHRVPFFLHWPKQGMKGGRDVPELAAHVDVLPTLIDLCEIPSPKGVKFDGMPIAPLLNGVGKEHWPDRILVTDSQRVKDPIKWRKSAVMTSKWRLVNGKELYDIKADPGQKKDVALQNSEVVARLTKFYDEWWADLEPSFSDDTEIYLGHVKDNPARLTSHDWIFAGSVPWNQAHIRKGTTHKAVKEAFWAVNVVEGGDYEIRLRRWPEESDKTINAKLPPGADVPGVKAFRTTPGVGIKAVKAELKIGDISESAAITADAKEVVFNVKLKAGRTKMIGTFLTKEGKAYGAYYAYVLKK